MDFILNSIQNFVISIFLAIVGTLVVSWIYASRLKKQYGADFPWSKTAFIVGIEVLLWIGFTIFWGFVKAFWFPIVVIAIIAIVLISRKKRKYV